ncbi:C-type mannose receptor 2-like isoform X2 [Mya arenaria]|uniref:C-type mannose receptor 2-like isoform X2 n=1 Tax=Mya arenaria TaxID=6604 RepID=UPI0022E7F92C|nr:C-type mannose receptor 2-like isoform X2 [Mya arenaria]
MDHYYLIGITILAACVGLSAAGTVCDDGWSPFKTSCYKFTTTRAVSQTSAASECSNQGSSLLRLFGQDEITWVTNQLKSTYPTSGVWTDLNDNPTNPITKLGTSVWKWGMYQMADMSLIQWNQSPANDGQSTCGSVNVQGKLADLTCQAREGFVCKVATTGGCALGWLSTDTACYWIANTTDPSQLKTWQDAKTWCSQQQQGAALLEISTQTDVDFLTMNLPYQAQNTKVYWIGLQYNNGQWGWSSGAQVQQNLVNWQSEPDNVAGIENCGVLRMTGKFSDRDCTSNANFVCYKPQYNTDTVDNLGCGQWIRAGKLCYGFMSTKLSNTWQGARSYCQQYGGDLVKVDSYDKVSWLNGQMVDPDNDHWFWTGLNDVQKEGTYVWADGSPVNASYINWNQEPNDYKGYEDCALITTTGQYNDMTCAKQAAAICEIDNLSSCPNSSWVSNGGNCYLFTPYSSASSMFIQQEAAAFCQTFSPSSTQIGALLSVDNKAEHDFIKQQVTQQKYADNVIGWWTSLSDKQTEGYWMFNSGPLLDQTLVDWTGEPSTKPGDNCGLITFAGAYHERECNMKLAFICEKYAYGVTAGSGMTSWTYSGLLLALAASLLSYLQ